MGEFNIFIVYFWLVTNQPFISLIQHLYRVLVLDLFLEINERNTRHGQYICTLIDQFLSVRVYICIVAL